MNIIAKPYRLQNKIQHYTWGAKNENAFIPILLEIKVTPDLPYAELWIGAHPKAPSEIGIGSTAYPLDKIIKDFPDEILGEYTARKFDGKLPFLLKILSAGDALSIQTHPNKEQAKRLHAADSENYPDDNHKPEIAIAIDSLIAVAGFRPVDEIISNIKNNPELLDFADDNLETAISSLTDENELKQKLKDLYGRIMKCAEDQDKLNGVITKIISRISSKKNLAIEEIQFIKQNKLYGNDVGLLSFFFFNIVQLNPGQAIFTDAGVPHAYIEGNIIECMANSDNVVRAGLTNKFKDVDTLLEIIDYGFSEFELINKNQQADEYTYKTSAEEFELTGYKKSLGVRYKITGGKPSVILILSGKLELTWKSGDSNYSEIFVKGESILIPALLDEYEISVLEDTHYYIVNIP